MLDEAHALKSSRSSRYRRLAKLRARQRVLLTGTPVQNNVAELLSLLTFMMPRVFPLSLASAFADGGPNGSHGDLSDAQVRRARRLLAPFILRRCKADVLAQLPRKVALAAISPRSRRDLAAISP